MEFRWADPEPKGPSPLDSALAELGFGFDDDEPSRSPGSEAATPPPPPPPASSSGAPTERAPVAGGVAPGTLSARGLGEAVEIPDSEPELALAPPLDPVLPSGISHGPADTGRKPEGRDRARPLAPEAEVEPEVADDETRVVLLVRDPRWLYAYWDVSREDRERFRLAESGARMTLRLFRVAAPGGDLEHSLDIAVQPHVRAWYLKVPESERRWRAAIGVLDERGGFRVLGFSNSVEPPRSAPLSESGGATAKGPDASAAGPGADGPPPSRRLLELSLGLGNSSPEAGFAESAAEPGDEEILEEAFAYGAGASELRFESRRTGGASHAFVPFGSSDHAPLGSR